jgi:hypothetical protein
MARSPAAETTTRTPTGDDARPLAFIYDRHAAPTKGALSVRLEKIRAYAAAEGLQIAGWFLDEKSDALSDTYRPALTALCNAMRSHGSRPMICLIHDWDRLSRDNVALALLRRKVSLAGGWTATIDGEDDRTPLAELHRGQP